MCQHVRKTIFFLAFALLFFCPRQIQAQAPSISGLALSIGGVGAQVPIYGSNFGGSQGSSTVTFNGTPATITGWYNSEIITLVPAGATTGPVVVTVGGVASNNNYSFAINGPVITGLSSHLGAIGDSVTIYGAGFGAAQGSNTVTFNGIATTATSWNNITIVVPVPSGAATGPVVVTVAGVASNSVSFTVGSPDTITGLSISSPANGATASTPYAAITGTVTGSISGIDPIVVSCNDVSAKLIGSNFSCNPPLSAGVNSITVTGTDSVGDTAAATISVTLAMPAPVSLIVTPGPVNVLVGQTQSFTAVDDQGLRRPDATWSVDNTTIASLLSGSPNTLMANATGQATLTATVAGVTAQTTVTVLP